MLSPDLNYQIFNQNCNSKFLLLCDHATNRIPKYISNTNLGLKSKQLKSHIAYDIGIKETALRLSKILNAPLILSNFSRLIIDPNRSENDPTSIMQIYDGVLILGNFNLAKSEIIERRKNFYDTYHDAISTFLRKKKNLTPCLISLHSFTPKLNLQLYRPWHVGVLWGPDRRMSDLVLSELKRYNDICIGENKPYSGNLKGDTLSKHAISNGLPHVLLEIRNDLISNSVGQKKWAEIIKTVLTNSILQLKDEKK